MGESQGQFDWSSIAPADEHLQLALEEYHAGRSFAEIKAILGRRGLSHEFTSEVMTALAKDRAFFLYSAGRKKSEVRDALIARGLSRDHAESIARDVEGSRDRALSTAGLGKWQSRSLISGGILLTAGVALYVLNQLAAVDVPLHWVMGLLGGGVVLAAVGGVYIVFDMR